MCSQSATVLQLFMQPVSGHQRPQSKLQHGEQVESGSAASLRSVLSGLPDRGKEAFDWLRFGRCGDKLFTLEPPTTEGHVFQTVPAQMHGLEI